MKYIKLINSFSHGSHHEIINSSILLMCCKISANITFYSSRETYVNYRKILLNSDKLNNILFKELPYLGGNGKFSELGKYVIGAIINIFIYLSSKKNEILIYNFNNLFFIHTLDLLSRIIPRTVIVFCHGELELLNKAQTKEGLLARLLRKKVYAHFIKRKKSLNKNLHLIVMGDSIAKNLMEYIDFDKFNIYSMDHPYIINEKQTNQIQHKRNGVLKLGTVGTFSVAKGGDSLIKLSKLLDLKRNKQIQIKVIGKSMIDVSILSDAGIIIPFKGSGYCPRKEFEEEVISLDYILFLYGSDSYKLTASGAIFDAIKYEKPIIALKNSYFEYLFKKYGAFGYLLDSVEEIADTINYLNCKTNSIYFNFDEIKRKISPETLVCDLEKIIDNID